MLEFLEDTRAGCWPSVRAMIGLWGEGSQESEGEEGGPGPPACSGL